MYYKMFKAYICHTKYMCYIIQEKSYLTKYIYLCNLNKNLSTCMYITL